jgi:hypothetical protein
VLLPQIEEHSRRVEDHDNLDDVAPKPVEQAIGPNDELAKVRTAELRNDAA